MIPPRKGKFKRFLRYSQTVANFAKKLYLCCMPRLTEQEQQEINRYLEADKPLPDKFRFLLFDEKREVELVWNGKTSETCNIVLPFQVIEQVDEPRVEKPRIDANKRESGEGNI